jgi:hypothetical protein
VNNSGGKFGFSVQKKVWIDCGGIPGEYDYDVDKKFADRVGWRRRRDWLSYEELTFLIGISNHAHLPSYLTFLMVSVFSLFSRNDL